MKIKAKVQSYTTKEIDVEFPCYVRRWELFDQGGGYEEFCRYESDGSYITITKTDEAYREESWEFVRSTIKNPGQLQQDLGYHLIEHDHRSTAEEFYAALDKMIVALNGVPR